MVERSIDTKDPSLNRKDSIEESDLETSFTYFILALMKRLQIYFLVEWLQHQGNSGVDLDP